MNMYTLALTKHKDFNPRRQAMVGTYIWREMTKNSINLCFKIEQLTALA